jgi:hypothetical protein
MVVVLRLEWNRLLDMYKSVYLVTTIRKSFLFGDEKWDTGLRKMLLKKIDLFLSRRSAGLEIAVNPGNGEISHLKEKWSLIVCHVSWNSRMTTRLKVVLWSIV